MSPLSVITDFQVFLVLICVLNALDDDIFTSILKNQVYSHECACYRSVPTHIPVLQVIG